MRLSWLVPAVLAAAAAAVPPVAGAVVPAPAARSDFNGDGYVDLAIGAPLETIGSARGAGAVNVLYGSATGPRASRAQLWHQNVPGVAGLAEEGDRFGATLASADFNHDGFADLAIAATHEDFGQGTDHGSRDDGAVHVLYGSASGLTAAGSEVWSGGEPAAPNTYVGFGQAFATGDFDDDGYPDLAAGAPGSGPAGEVLILRGSAGGLVEGRLFTPLYEASYDMDYAGYGSALAAGDFDGSGVDDLAVGAPYWNDVTGSQEEVLGAGKVQVLVGAAETGLSYTGSYSLDQDSPSVPDDAEPYDLFGAALSAGDYDGDGKADLAVGVPGETVGDSTARTGAVTVLPGSPNGVTGAGSTFWHRDGGGLPGRASTSSGLGTALASADLTGDGKADLVVGVGKDEVGSLTNAGSVNVVYGSASGLTAAFAHLWHQNVAGVPGSAEAGDYFGHAAGTGDYNRDGRADLAVGAPREGFSGLSSAGTVTVLRGGAERVTSSGATLWHQDVAGVPGTAETADWFGGGLAAN